MTERDADELRGDMKGTYRSESFRSHRRSQPDSSPPQISSFKGLTDGLLGSDSIPAESGVSSDTVHLYMQSVVGGQGISFAFMHFFCTTFQIKTIPDKS